MQPILTDRQTHHLIRCGLGNQNWFHQVKYQDIPLAKPMDGLKYGERQLDNIWKRMSVLVTSVWTRH